jgi:hypothetical protein
MQSATGEQNAVLEPGIPLNTLTFDQQKSYGVEIYELTVAIPGAQFSAVDAASADAAAGMEAMGL